MAYLAAYLRTKGFEPCGGDSPKQFTRFGLLREVYTEGIECARNDNLLFAFTICKNFMDVVRYYSISAVNILVACEDREVGERVNTALKEYFSMVETETCRNKDTITLRFKNHACPVKFPETARELTSFHSLHVLKDGNSSYRIRDGSVFQIDLLTSVDTGFLGKGFWGWSQKVQQEFFMLTLLWLLHGHNHYGLHANGLVKDGAGILLVGDTGSGKTTISLSLIVQGWNYLSDDVALLARDSCGITARAFQRGFSIDPFLARYYSGLNKDFEIQIPGKGKVFLDISGLYPNAYLASCIPRVLIFPKIVPLDKTRLVPIDRMKALIYLMLNSGGSMIDKARSIRQMDVLKQLVYQSV